MIYFIQSGYGGPIKIGKTNDVWRRLGDIQTHNPEKLTILGVLDETPGMEMHLHVLFRDLRIRGEWYKPRHRLRKWIARNTIVPYGKKRDTRGEEKAQRERAELEKTQSEAEQVKVIWSHTLIGATVISTYAHDNQAQPGKIVRTQVSLDDKKSLAGF